MDEVLEKFDTALQPISQANNSNKEGKENFESLYKNWGRLGNQEERRKEILEQQKSNRYNKLDTHRGIVALVKAANQKDIFHSNSRSNYRPSIYVAGFSRPSSEYQNVLMLSEWMIEKPKDFDDNWFVVPCPKGVRMLVVAHQGITKCYTKYGQFRFECPTALPSGNPGDVKKKDIACVLDCFYEDKSNTMYVLDVLAWKNQPMTDGETEFRHYWLKSMLSEIPQLKYINRVNKVLFNILPYTPCTPDSFNKFMSAYPAFECNFPPLDGLLFYHKQAQYVGGETPLVGWLFPYMVPEIFGSDITVNEAYLVDKPAGYVDQADFIQKFETKMAKKSRGPRSSSSMDTAEVCKDENENDTRPNSTQRSTDVMESDETNEPAQPKEKEHMESDMTESTHIVKANDMESVTEAENQQVEKDNMESQPSVDNTQAE